MERIRKSDLIVLDYNLTPGDTRMSIGLVRQLARTKHFNTIIVYTAEENLNAVWLNFAAALRGGWRERTEAEAAADQLLGELSDREIVLEQPSQELIGNYTVGLPVQNRADEWKGYGETLKAAGIDKADWVPLIEARIRREVLDILKDDRASAEAELHAVDGRVVKDGPLWLQSGNCFVAIMGKPKDDPRAVAPDHLFDALDAALCNWRPNILQIIVSEIQNILESDALATHELHLRDPHTQVSLCYFLLMAVGHHNPAPEALEFPVHILLDKLVDGVRQSLITDQPLRQRAREMLSSELGRLKIEEKGDAAAMRRAIFDAARRMAGTASDLESRQALLKLNAFLSSEPFRGHLTTGTVFEAEGVHWICMTPACDMVDRLPMDGQDWLQDLHPMKPIIAVKLLEKNEQLALNHAEQSRSVFLQTPTCILTFDVVPASGGPSYEIIYLAGGPLAQEAETLSFQGFRMRRAGAAAEPPTALLPMTYRVVGQVRADYASRFLQATGGWLSRIGVDFIRGTG